MHTHSGRVWLGAILLLVWTASGGAEERKLPTTQARPDHRVSAHEHEEGPETYPDTPTLPEGMSLDEVLDRASRPPSGHFPDPVPDDELRFFALFEQVEYRLQGDGRDQLGWEAQGWIGFDYDKLWVKLEGESVFEGRDEGESETDVLYSRLITPFWNAQVGVQYANAWEGSAYSDRWSGVKESTTCG